jgi:hypothetical protein
MEFGPGAGCPHPLENATESSAAALCGLHRQCLAHDRAPARNDLKVRDCPSAARDWAGGGGKTAESCGAS